MASLQLGPVVGAPAQADMKPAVVHDEAVVQDEAAAVQPVAAPAAAITPAAITPVTTPVTAPAPAPDPEAVDSAIEQAALDDAERAALLEEVEKAKHRYVPGLDNADLVTLLHAFDKHVHNVRTCPPSRRARIPAGLDLQAAPDEEFTVDKLRSALERFYASVVVGLGRAWHEVQRIRRWEDGGRRTLVAMIVYILAWSNGLIWSTLVAFAVVLVMSPAARRYCFDPARATRIQQLRHFADTGHAHGGPSSTEARAAAWADTVQGVIMSFATPGGKSHGAQKDIAGKVDAKLADDMRRHEETGDKAQGSTEGTSSREKTVELFGQPVIRLVGGVADKWERMQHALSPRTPYLEPRRGTVASVLLPLLPVTTLVSARMWSQMFGAVFGILLFGRPVTHVIVARLDARFPHWRQAVVLECNILEHVPNNIQLVLRILRDAEHQRRPLPPADDLWTHDEESDDESEPGDEDLSKKVKVERAVAVKSAKVVNATRSRARRLWDRLGAAKEDGFARITGRKHVDYAGNARPPDPAAAARLPNRGIVPDETYRFYVHHKRHGPGHLVVHPPTLPDAAGAYTPARVSFTTVKGRAGAPLAPGQGQPVDDRLTVSINDVVAIKKKGLGWPTRIVAGWALDAEGVGGTGLEITVRRCERTGASLPLAGKPHTAAVESKLETLELAGIVRRNELFDRLLAIGEQTWEMV